MFWPLGEHLSKHMPPGSQKCILPHVMAPKRTLQHLFGSEEGTYTYVMLQEEGTSACFGSKEDTSALFWLLRGHQEKGSLALWRTLGPKKKLWQRFWLTGGHFSTF